MTERNRRPRHAVAKFLAYQVRQAMERDGVTIVDLSRETGLSRSHIGDLLAGTANGTYAQWTSLLTALGEEVPD